MKRDRLEESILTASRIMVNILAESLLEEKAEAISVAQFRILDMVANLTDKPSEIAKMLSVTPAAISSLVEKLEWKGLVLREFSTQDRRRVVVQLTELGKGIVERVNTQRRRRLGRILREMEPEERENLETALIAFNRSYPAVHSLGAVSSRG